MRVLDFYSPPSPLPQSSGFVLKHSRPLRGTPCCPSSRGLSMSFGLEPSSARRVLPISGRPSWAASLPRTPLTARLRPCRLLCRPRLPRSPGATRSRKVVGQGSYPSRKHGCVHGLCWILIMSCPVMSPLLARSLSYVHVFCKDARRAHQRRQGAGCIPPGKMWCPMLRTMSPSSLSQKKKPISCPGWV